MDYSSWLNKAAEELHKSQIQEFGDEGCTLLDAEEFVNLVEGAYEAFESGQTPEQFVKEFTS